jgi:hypothetical protein
LRSTRSYAWALRICTWLFVLRILGQLVQEVGSVSFLPPREDWQGSALPYPLLLGLQLLIVGGFIWGEQQVRHERWRRKRRLGKFLLLSGTVYGGAMLLRLIAGAANFTTEPWFHKPIPAAFHVVIASYLLILAKYHLFETDERSSGTA